MNYWYLLLIILVVLYFNYPKINNNENNLDDLEIKNCNCN